MTPKGGLGLAWRQHLPAARDVRGIGAIVHAVWDGWDAVLEHVDVGARSHEVLVTVILDGDGQIADHVEGALRRAIHVHDRVASLLLLLLLVLVVEHVGRALLKRDKVVGLQEGMLVVLLGGVRRNQSNGEEHRGDGSHTHRMHDQTSSPRPFDGDRG